MQPNVTQEDIEKSLRAVGLKAGDIVLAHSSLRSFGYVEGGADAVLDALLATISPGGTLVLPTFTWGRFHDQEKVLFDVNETPSECGRITEVFRKRKGVIRSRHVCHSVAALGPCAEDVLGDGVSSFGPGSTFDRLCRLDSWVLFLGVGFSSCTALHMVEEFIQVPYRRYRDFNGSTVILPDGTEQPSRSVEFLRKPGYRNDFERVEDVFCREGILRIARVGRARIISARIRDIFRVTRAHMERDIGFLLSAESKRLLEAQEARHDPWSPSAPPPAGKPA